jgi:hypothetical protein
MDSQTPLQRAIDAIRSGDRIAGRRLLAQVLHADPQNVQAWLWMSEVADTGEQRRECLLRALAIDPGNQAARAGLARLTEPPARPTKGRSRDSRIEVDGPSITMERDWEIAPTDSRRKAERYIVLAGAMSLTLLIGLILLLVALTTVVPQARARWALTTEPALGTATLWCPSCERQGQPVLLSVRIGAGYSRGGQAGALPHGTRVSVLRYRWSALERRYYVLIAAEGQRGWVPETQIRR